MLAGVLFRSTRLASSSSAATAVVPRRRLLTRLVRPTSTALQQHHLHTLTLSATTTQRPRRQHRGLATSATGVVASPAAAAAAANATSSSSSSSSTTNSTHTADTFDMSESIKLVRAMCVRTFDETILMNIHLNVDPRKPNQMVRGLAQLPYGSGKQSIVAVFARGERAFEAKQAGADIVGDQDLADKILAGTVDFTRCIATPDMMPVVSKVARILGPKGLMPNPKTGTVTHAIGAAVKSAKQGQVEFKTDKDGTIKAPLGKASFAPDKLAANLTAFVKAVIDAKPTGAKGVYLKRAYLVGAMTPAVEMDLRMAPFRA